MSWDQNAHPDFVVPPMPTAPPPAPADPLRAVAVALLNLSGLGLGYALVRRWVLMIACLVATGILLLVALPADPDGVPGALLVLYLIVLVAAAVHGARLGLRTRLAWPPNALVAAVLGIVLLAVPAGGAVLYDHARDEATEQMLLDRLARADEKVSRAGAQSFAVAEADYRQALSVYHGLAADHPHSRAAAKVPSRLKTYYTTVAGPYAEQNYCDAVPPLKYLRTVPRTIGKKTLGTLSTWPDDRLATSLYACAAASMSSETWTTQVNDLLATFPKSEQARKVGPTVDAEVGKAVKAVGGSDPCAAVRRLDSLSTQIRGVSGEQAGIADTLAKSADRAQRSAVSGTYNCGVAQYKDGSFSEAVTSMDKFVKDNPGSAHSGRARKIAIAAEVAETVPAAGKRLPTTRSGGSIAVTVKNDSPDNITVLYTGPVTGSFSLKACGSCTTYSALGSSLFNSKPCSDSGKNYPQKTIRLPAGTTYFVHKSQSGLGKTPASDTAKLRSGYIYTECAYTTSLSY
ncbi:hypothetical protein ACIRPX_18620 [Streptomyces sp. NPDC101225]|uniref:hypothetical protein n=1 Tax=Streptomyces sp. NPDC101225 TaxID=3366135 RepID=UPI0038024CFE